MTTLEALRSVRGSANADLGDHRQNDHPYDPAQNQPPAPGQQPMPPTAQFPQVPAGQYPPPPGQFPQRPGQYPQRPGGWQQPGAPAAPAARKRPWLIPTLIGVGAFVVLCCGGSMVIGLASDNGKKTDVSASSDIPAVTTSTSAPAAAAPAPTALAIPAGHKMTPAKWCTTYAKVFIQLGAKRDKISDLRGTQYKNGVALDNTKRTAQADALWAEVEAFDPGQAIADALVSLPHSSYEEAALAAPDGAKRQPRERRHVARL
ncbi:hypothetical protein [Micromonospora sp. IBHARD004]|uniref:hypothetical protein n=1 Tax=Micromonospora sp. IBHARD004 TaxID=3457764 RepID=UPI004057DF91